ncbi:MAG: hypothetical protein K1060chlam2_00199 [Chlamydiae bacterium]|nr:hypothetical protein [Chlamydiota bacterium]
MSGRIQAGHNQSHTYSVTSNFLKRAHNHNERVMQDERFIEMVPRARTMSRMGVVHYGVRPFSVEMFYDEAREFETLTEKQIDAHDQLSKIFHELVKDHVGSSDVEFISQKVFKSVIKKRGSKAHFKYISRLFKEFGMHLKPRSNRFSTQCHRAFRDLFDCIEKKMFISETSYLSGELLRLQRQWVDRDGRES